MQLSRKTRILIFVVASLFVFFVGGRYGLKAFRYFQSRHFLRLAEESFIKEDYERAVRFVRKVLVRNPKHTRGLWLMAELARIGGSPLELDFRQRLAEVTPALTNQLALVECALRLEKPPYPIATTTLDRLSGIATNDIGYHLLSAQFALKMGDRERAEKHLAEALTLEPTNKLVSLNLSTLRATHSDPQVASTARTHLITFSSDPDLGIYALRALITVYTTEGDYTKAALYAKMLVTNPAAEFADHLLYLSTLLKADRETGEAYLTTLKKAAQTNLLTIVQLSGWLNSNERAHEAIDWLGSLPWYLKETIPVQMAFANACMRAGQWALLQSRLESQQWAENEYLRLAFLARALREMRRMELSTPVWQRAISEAARQPENLFGLAQLAAGWGWKSESESLLLRIARNYGNYRWVFNVLQQMYMDQGDTVSLLKLFQVWLETMPGSPVVKNNLAAVLLLLGRDVGRAAFLAAEAYRAESTNVVFASTYAFALFKRGDFQAALQIMNRFSEESLEKDPSVAGYYALILYANGLVEKARRFATLALDGKILPEERALFESVLHSSD